MMMPRRAEATRVRRPSARRVGDIVAAASECAADTLQHASARQRAVMARRELMSRHAAKR